MSEQVESSNSEDDSTSEVNAESHDEIQTGGLDDTDAAAVHQTDPNLPVFDQTYGPQVHGLLLIFLSTNLYKI